MSQLPGYLTMAETAEAIGVSVSQVSRYVSNQLLKPIDLGHQLLFKKTDVAKFERPPRGNPAFRKQSA